MCGLTGFIDLSRDKKRDNLVASIQCMTKALIHRGPDSDGIWVDEEKGVALGHRRLSVLDLSEQGHQPMVSHTGRYVLTYNGEIYNFRDLRQRLETNGYQFLGQSDTEVLLASIEVWGVERSLQGFNGMFAFALWDREEQTLHLARDRMGKKPLYYGWAGHILLFASELKAFHQHSSFQPQINRDALALYGRHNYVPTPWSIYKNVFKLQPASFISIPLKGNNAVVSGQALHANAVKFWNIKEIAEAGSANLRTGPIDEAIDELDVILSEAVDIRMVSDVPLGAFLSGGIDSSLIVALMQKQANSSVKTYSIGFEESDHNEAEHAKKVAAHLGTDHTEFYVTAADAQNTIPNLPAIFDEPFADPSQIPTWHVSHLASQHVTVALSGDGGDEGFTGYDRYLRAQKLWNGLFMVPEFFRHATGKALGTLPISSSPMLDKISRALQVREEDDLYRLIMSYWKNSEKLVHGAEWLSTAMTASESRPDVSSFIERMTYWDLVSYLPDDILVKVDRASMSVGLETRAPLLDYKVIEFSRSLPTSMKIDGGGGKLILRKLLSRYVPQHLIDRPKQGFGIPHSEWIRGPLKDWAEHLLDENLLRQQGFFDVAKVRKKWKLHCDRRQDWGYHLWSILMFQAWFEYWDSQ